jgi:histone acetyltransferase (RNA polymerase elongator complex component)
VALIIPIFLPHRGCTHQCLFCNQQGISGCIEQSLTVDEVRATIDLWLDRGGRGEVQAAFYGGSFTCLPLDEQRALLGAVQPYMAGGRVHSLRLSTRPDCLDPEVCRMLQDHGVKTVELGVQSLDDQVLRESRRGHDGEQSRQAIRLLQSWGFIVGVQLLLGLPGETRRSFLRGVAEIARLHPDFVRLYPLLVVKGSGLAERYQQGLYRPLSLGLAVALTAAAHQRLSEKGVRVVRMGLQPCRSLDENYLAGPYHPAFGELVRGRLVFKELRARLAGLRPGQHLQVHISHRDHGTVVGMSGVNLKRLGELGFSGRFTILPEKKRARGSMDYVVG